MASAESAGTLGILPSLLGHRNQAWIPASLIWYLTFHIFPTIVLVGWWWLLLSIAPIYQFPWRTIITWRKVLSTDPFWKQRLKQHHQQQIKSTLKNKNRQKPKLHKTQMYYTYRKKAKITPKHTKNVLFNFVTQCQICSITLFTLFLLKPHKRML